MNAVPPSAAGEGKATSGPKALPSEEELQDAWDNVASDHEAYLAIHDVRLPRQSEYKWIHLAMLYHFMSDPDPYVSKDLISIAVQRQFAGAARDQQVRHLKRDGWEIEKGRRGTYRLKSTNRPSTEFLNRRARGESKLAAKSFEELKKKLGNRCATCGAKENRPDPRYGDDPVHLQQGHQDPEGPSNDSANIIPQCQYCNQTYQDHFVFDELGRVKTIASTRPLERVSDQTEEEIRRWAEKKWFGSGPPSSDAK